MTNSQTDNSTITLRQRILLGRVIGVLIVLGALAGGILVWRINYQHPRTNDAMVRANIVGIAPEVSGRIVALHVADNQYVKQGDLLYQIDPRPYQAKLDLAKAELQVAEKEADSRRASSDTAQLTIAQLEHQRTAAEAEVKKLEAEDDYLRHYVERLQPLAEQQFVTADQFKLAGSRYAASRAALADARAKVLAAGSAIAAAQSEGRRAVSLVAQVGNVNARVEAAKAVLAAAELDVEYCTVRAPFDAYVTNLNIREGEYAKTGMQLFALVDDRQWYVIADFKETYLRAIHPGQPAEVFLLAYPGKRFQGVVTGIGWANYPDNIKQQGVLPEVQRTLNWVMLASRFPVRIEVYERDPQHPLRMGMTAFVTLQDPPAATPAVRPGQAPEPPKTQAADE